MRTDALKEIGQVIYGKSGIKLLCATVEQAGACCFAPHWHERLELLRVTRGTLELRLDSNTLVLRPGQVAIVDSKQLHGGFAGKAGVTYQALMFDAATFLNNTLAAQEDVLSLVNDTLSFCDISEEPAVLTAVDTLICTLQTSDEHPLCAVGEVYRLLGTLCRCCTVKRQAPRTLDTKFNQVLDHIALHYTQRLTASGLSKRFNYSEAYFCRLFKQRTGLTASTYIRILRLELAQQLLRRDDLDIAAVAARCGFADTAYFCNCFRREFALTPSDYRRQALESTKAT